MMTEEILKAISDEQRKHIDDAYFRMRQKKCKWITEESIQTYAYCIAIQKLGLRVTVELISALQPNTTSHALTIRLHNLGDKKLINLIRSDKESCFSWILTEGV